MVIQGTGAQQKTVSIHPYGALVGAGSLVPNNYLWALPTVKHKVQPIMNLNIGRS